jgi:sterol desaturase/sphingolipid hydroxylase (fatty acid hydroxylase superfamily)
MAVEKEQIYQAIIFVTVVLFFDFLERHRPALSVHRLLDLPLNILALFIVIVAGELWKALLLSGFNALTLGEGIFLTSLHRIPGTVKIILGLILADGSLYWVHRAMHRPGLWRAHKFHHSIREIWWLSGSRTSFMHLLLFAVPQIFIAYFLLKLTTPQAGVAFSIGVIVNIWIHTNLWVNLGPVGRIIITPNYHRIHHGAMGLSAKNLGFLFPIWDKIFGTYVDPQSMGKDIPIGSVLTSKALFRMIVGL